MSFSCGWWLILSPRHTALAPGAQTASIMTTFAEVLKEIGAFGLFQKRLVAILCIPSLFVSFDVIGQVFTGLNFPHYCNTDWILRLGDLTEERQKNLTIPVKSDGSYESCSMFEPISWDLVDIEAYGLNGTTECVNGSVFQAPHGASSIVTEVSLILRAIFFN